MNTLTTGGVAIPSVEVHGQFRLGNLLKPLKTLAVSLGQLHLVDGLLRDQWCGELTHQHLLTNDLPDTAAVMTRRQLRTQPILLIGAQDRPLRVHELLFDKRLCTAEFLKVTLVDKLLVATVKSRIQHDQIRQLPYFKGAIDGCLIGLSGRSNGHPLVIYLSCNRDALVKITLTFVVIFRTLFPGVIGQFMVVPDTDPRVRCMRGL